MGTRLDITLFNQRNKLALLVFEWFLAHMVFSWFYLFFSCFCIGFATILSCVLIVFQCVFDPYGFLLVLCFLKWIFDSSGFFHLFYLFFKMFLMCLLIGFMCFIIGF